MYRPALRATAAVATPFARSAARSQAGKRFASTASKSSGSWRGAAARWGLAGGLVYYYNTSSIFAEEPPYALHAPEAAHQSETYSTVDSIAEQRRAQARAQPQPSPSQTDPSTVTVVPDDEQIAAGSPGALEEEASQQGAFNEETGEINWDCSCLGGMAYGPCGEQFRAAFSCFVFSKEDPKGVDCIEHFKTMQNCFREHPEIYGSELDDDEELQPLEGEEGQGVPAPVQPQAASVGKPASQEVGLLEQSGPKAGADSDSVPKAWHDSREKSAAQ